MKKILLILLTITLMVSARYNFFEAWPQHNGPQDLEPTISPRYNFFEAWPSTFNPASTQVKDLTLQMHLPLEKDLIGSTEFNCNPINEKKALAGYAPATRGGYNAACTDSDCVGEFTIRIHEGVVSNRYNFFECWPDNDNPEYAIKNSDGFSMKINWNEKKEDNKNSLIVAGAILAIIGLFAYNKTKKSNNKK